MAAPRPDGACVPAPTAAGSPRRDAPARRRPCCRLGGRTASCRSATRTRVVPRGGASRCTISSCARPWPVVTRSAISCGRRFATGSSSRGRSRTPGGGPGRGRGRGAGPRVVLGRRHGHAHDPLTGPRTSPASSTLASNSSAAAHGVARAKFAGNAVSLTNPSISRRRSPCGSKQPLPTTVCRTQAASRADASVPTRPHLPGPRRHRAAGGAVLAEQHDECAVARRYPARLRPVP